MLYKVYIVNWTEIINLAMIQFTSITSNSKFFEVSIGGIFGDLKDNYVLLNNGSTRNKASLEVSDLLKNIHPVNGSGTSNSFNLYQRLVNKGK